MKEIKTDKLVLIEGGIDVSGAVINSFTAVTISSKLQ